MGEAEKVGDLGGLKNKEGIDISTHTRPHCFLLLHHPKPTTESEIGLWPVPDLARPGAEP